MDGATTLMQRASNLDCDFETGMNARGILIDETARIREGGTVDESIHQGVLAIIEGDNDCKDAKELAAYLRAAIDADAALAEGAVEALLRALEANGPLSWIRSSTLQKLVESRGRVEPAYEALRKHERRVFDMVRSNLHHTHNADGLFEYVLAARELADGESRELHRLLERFALATNVNADKQRFKVKNFPQEYHPGPDDDVDAIEPLMTIVIECSRVGFPLCREAIYELARYEPHRVTTVGARLFDALDEDQVEVLATLLLSGGYVYREKMFAASPNISALLLPLCDFSSSHKGRVKMRRLLLKLGIIDLERVPEDDRRDIPKELPRSLEDAEALRSKLEVTLSEKTRRADESLPAPILELLNYPQLVNLLRVENFAALADDLANILENHRADLDEESVAAGLRVELDAVQGHVAFLPVGGLVPFATDSNGDIFALSERVRSPDDEWPVFRIHHGEAFAASVAAASVGELAARGLIEEWSRRESLEHFTADLLRRPLPPPWLGERLK